MSKYFKKIKHRLASSEDILALPDVDRTFLFREPGAYFFISPTSGIFKIKIIKSYASETDKNGDLLRFINFKFLSSVLLEDMADSHLLSFLRDNIKGINKLQRHTIKLIGLSKLPIDKPGNYLLQLSKRTINYTRFEKNRDNPYFLFNGIYPKLLEFYLIDLKENSRKLDDYLNEPFGHFLYNLEGLFIHLDRLPQKVTDRMVVGEYYYCKVDYKTSMFTPINPILKIRYILYDRSRF